MTNSVDIADLLADFKAAAGPKFKNDTLSQLLTKYMLYQLYPNEWPEMMKEVYSRSPEALIVQQIKALRQVDRKKLMNCSNKQCFRILSMIEMPSRVQRDTNTLVVKNRSTRYQVPHYVNYVEKEVDEASLGRHFDELSDAGFALAMTEPAVASRILISPEVREHIHSNTNQVQHSILPALNRISSENRSAKLNELCVLLSYSTLREISAEEKQAFQAQGLTAAAENRQNRRLKKVELAERLRELEAERVATIKTLDASALAKRNIKIDDLNRTVGEIGEMRREQISATIDYLESVMPVIRQCQLDENGIRKLSLARIEELHERRGQLVKNLDFQTYYRENQLSAEVNHMSENLHKKAQYDLDNYEKRLEGMNSVLERYQRVAKLETKQPVSVGYF